MPLPRRTMMLATLGGVLLRPARADNARLQAAVVRFAAGAPVHAGRVNLDVAGLIDNGNAVPITVTADSPMTATDHVTRLALFSELNPYVDILGAELTALMGRARVSTRIRLAQSQQLVAVAAMRDGSVWQHTVDVVVTLAACIET